MHASQRQLISGQLKSPVYSKFSDIETSVIWRTWPTLGAIGKENKTRNVLG